MNFRVVRSLRAAAEIREIAIYLAEYSPPATQRFLDAMQNARDRLAGFPNSGAAGLSPGTRRLIVDNYIVSYRVRRDSVQIYAVRHAKRRDAMP